MVQFGHTLGWIKDSKGHVVARGRLVGNMYRRDCKVDKPGNQPSVVNETCWSDEDHGFNGTYHRF